MAVSTNINSVARPLFSIKTIDQFIPTLIQAALTLGSVLSFMWLLWGGVEFIMAGGNQERTKTAKSKISQAIFGLGMLASVWVFWRIITYFLGITTSPSGSVRLTLPTP